MNERVKGNRGRGQASLLSVYKHVSCPWRRLDSEVHDNPIKVVSPTWNIISVAKSNNTIIFIKHSAKSFIYIVSSTCSFHLKVDSCHSCAQYSSIMFYLKVNPNIFIVSIPNPHLSVASASHPMSVFLLILSLAHLVPSTLASFQFLILTSRSLHRFLFFPKQYFPRCPCKFLP